MGLLLIILLVLLVVGALPAWSYNSGRNWGYAPSGGLGLIVVVLLVLFLMGRL